MNIEITCSATGYHIVALRGELRTEQGAAVTDELHPLIGERGARMVIDLSGVPMIDSSGLSCLISLATHAKLSQSRLVLAGATPFVSGVIAMSQLDKWFEMVAEVAEADALLSK